MLSSAFAALLPAHAWEADVKGIRPLLAVFAAVMCSAALAAQQAVHEIDVGRRGDGRHEAGQAELHGGRA